ncbi:MAG: flagellar export protein FliJ [Glaciimonas sp.]|nr:flagellar export protein FliJ [Glaciimonas sp.]
MASTSQLNTLISLAEKKTDDAAKMLGVAIRAGEEAEQKLALLQQYRDDYAARLESTRSVGLSIMSHQNYQVFLGKLDSAIIGQEVTVEHEKRRIAESRSAWQENARKKMSFGALSQRAQKEAQRLEDKRDQKLMDEHAARLKAYKR